VKHLAGCVIFLERGSVTRSTVATQAWDLSKGAQFSAELLRVTDPRSFGYGSAAAGDSRLFLNSINQLAGRIVLDTAMRSDYADNRVEQ
jgi:hypothetical protein